MNNGEINRESYVNLISSSFIISYLYISKKIEPLELGSLNFEYINVKYYILMQILFA